MKPYRQHKCWLPVAQSNKSLQGSGTIGRRDAEGKYVLNEGLKEELQPAAAARPPRQGWALGSGGMQAELTAKLWVFSTATEPALPDRGQR